MMIRPSPAFVTLLWTFRIMDCERRRKQKKETEEEKERIIGKGGIEQKECAGKEKRVRKGTMEMRKQREREREQKIRERELAVMV